MTKQKIDELEFEMTSCFIAYDTETGEILYIHECLKQKDAYVTQNDPDEDTVLQMARAEFDDRSLNVMKMPEDFEIRNDKIYSVDKYSGELVESDENTMKFRDFYKQENE